MKYLIMIYSNPATWEHPMFLHQGDDLSEQERKEKRDRFEALMAEIHASGELISGDGLDAPATARTVRLRDAQLITTDGPYVDAKEHLAGIFVVDCADMDRAVEIAGRFPDAGYGGIEVRRVST